MKNLKNSINIEEIKLQEISIEVKEIGKNELFEQREIISKFVEENFNLLYEGACRLGKEIEEDCYTSRRIQINNTRLNPNGLKYCDGHKYNNDCAPSEEQLKTAVKDIQNLIDAAAEHVKCSFEIKIIEK